MRLNAYYYSFGGTGEEMVDRVLSAVACAGKAFHYTSEWTEPYFEPPSGQPSEYHTDEGYRYAPYEPFLRGETCVDQIQNAALDVAAEMRRLRDEVADLRRRLSFAGDRPLGS